MSLFQRFLFGLLTILALPSAAEISRLGDCQQVVLNGSGALLTMVPEFAAEALPFWQALIHGYVSPVRYFGEEERADREVFVDGGLLVNRDGIPVSTQGQKYLYVVTSRGELIVAPGSFLRTRHSSLAAGQAVVMAGKMSLEGGKIRWIDNDSGHYQPKDRAFLTFVSALRRRGLSIDLVYPVHGRVMVGREVELSLSIL